MWIRLHEIHIVLYEQKCWWVDGVNDFKTTKRIARITSANMVYDAWLSGCSGYINKYLLCLIAVFSNNLTNVLRVHVVHTLYKLWLI